MRSQVCVYRVFYNCLEHSSANHNQPITFIKYLKILQKQKHMVGKDMKENNDLIFILGLLSMLQDRQVLAIYRLTILSVTLQYRDHFSVLTSCLLEILTYWLFIILKHIFCMTIFWTLNTTQYLNLTTTLLTINKQQIRSLFSQKS